MAVARPEALPKPAPVLQKETPGRLRMFLDLLWLVGLMARTTPLPFWGWTAIALLQGLLVPAQLWLTKSLVDALATQLRGGEAAHTFLWLGLLVASLLLDRALTGVQPWLQAAVREETGSTLQERVMCKSSMLDLASFEHQGYYDQLSLVISDVETRAPQLLDQAQQVVRAIPQLLGYAVALASLTPLLLAVILASNVPVVVGWVVSGQINYGLVNRQTREQRLSEYYARVLTDRRFAKEVRLYGLAGYLLGRWAELFWKNRIERRQLLLRMNLRLRSANIASSVVVLGGLWWIISAGLVHATAGGYALLFQSLNGITGSLFGLGAALQGLGEHSGYASAFRAFTRQPVEEVVGALGDGARPALASGQSSNIPAVRATLRPFPRPLVEGISFEGVWYTYPGSEVPALRDVSLHIRAGERVALVGANGAGKTTITRLLTGLYRPDEGRITADGLDYTRIEPVSLRQGMSGVFQLFTRYELTLCENVWLGDPQDPLDERRVWEALERAGAEEIARGLTEGIRTLLGPEVGGVDLSGGQWQRVALARAFYRDAEVLVLDEPTAALDPIAELRLFERFTELARGRTALLISHRLGMARLADRVVVLDGGRIIEEGTHEELMERGGLYRRMFESQARWYR